jgi:hypothetical protein
MDSVLGKPALTATCRSIALCNMHYHYLYNGLQYSEIPLTAVRLAKVANPIQKHALRSLNLVALWKKRNVNLILSFSLHSCCKLASAKIATGLESTRLYRSSFLDTNRQIFYSSKHSSK